MPLWLTTAGWLLQKEFKYCLNVQFFRVQGGVSADKRKTHIDDFNKSTLSKVQDNCQSTDFCQSMPAKHLAHFPHAETASAWLPCMSLRNSSTSCKPSNMPDLVGQAASAGLLAGVQVFLGTTKAAGIGINLVSARRAIIMDEPMNPSHNKQVMRCCFGMPCQPHPAGSMQLGAQ